MQICKDLYRCSKLFCTDFSGIFFRSFWETMYCILCFFNRLFSQPRLRQLKLHQSNFLSMKACPQHGNFSRAGNVCYWSYTNLSISLELSRSGCSTLRGSSAILTLFWRMNFDMWQPYVLVEVLIK